MVTSANTAARSERLGVFLCHSHGDKEFVRDLYVKLLAEGFDPWLDQEKLLPGQDWQYEIARAVRKSDVVAVCMSLSSVSKEGFLQKEIKSALDVADEKPEGTIFIIPARIEECTIPDRLRRWHWVDLFHKGGYEKLVKALHARAKDLKIATPEDGPKLTEVEELALGLVLADPNAGDRGAWMYPLHGYLTERGRTKAEATLALSGLTAKGLLQFVEVPGWDSFEKKRTKSPAYRLTPSGIEYASRHEKIQSFVDKYRYALVLRGTEKKNQPMLEYLWTLPYVERQTRFVTENKPGHVAIAIFSYQPFTESQLREESQRLKLAFSSLQTF